MTDRPPINLILLTIGALLLSYALSGLAYGAAPPSGVPEVLQAAPVHRSDLGEAPDNRAERLQRYASAVEQAAPDDSARALLLAVGRFESHWAAEVCDGPRTGDDGRAVGCWQSWEADAGASVAAHARRAAVHLRRAGNYCVARGYPRIAGAVSLYATGRSCRWPGAAERVAYYHRALATLRGAR